jgi:membrane fusion protein, multidrug efflux system
VPVSALRHGGNGEFVFVLQDDRTVSLRPVTRGQATVDKVQIVGGLQFGEHVITEGADRLRDGSRVVLPASGLPPEAAGRRTQRMGAAGGGPQGDPPAGASR